MNAKKIIKSARVLKGLTQAQLAKKLGVHQSTIAIWEEDISHVSFYNVDRLCRILEIEDINILRGCR